jgi:hypothetical protein
MQATQHRSGAHLGALADPMADRAITAGACGFPHSTISPPTGFGPAKILERTVAQAQVYYAVPDIQATCAAMRFFDYEVRWIWRLSKATRKATSWKITTAQMDDWLGQSGNIQIALACTSH